jgi:hypothetical protein
VVILDECCATQLAKNAELASVGSPNVGGCGGLSIIEETPTGSSDKCVTFAQARHTEAILGAEIMNFAPCPMPLKNKGLAGAEYRGRVKAYFPVDRTAFVV